MSGLTRLAWAAVVVLGTCLPAAGAASDQVLPQAISSADKAPITLHPRTNAGDARVDVVLRVATGIPHRTCSGRAELRGRKADLGHLITGSKKGGAQWHWQMHRYTPGGVLHLRVSCLFPGGRWHSRAVGIRVLPGAEPRRDFRAITAAHSLRHEQWVPSSQRDGSGGDDELYPRGQCTWYVSTQRPDLPYFSGADGNALNWLTAAIKAGLPTGKAPRVGAVVVFAPGQYEAGTYGHVAVVTAVMGSLITIKEANFKGRPPGSLRTISWENLNFIYHAGETDPSTDVGGHTGDQPPPVPINFYQCTILNDNTGMPITYEEILNAQQSRTQAIVGKAGTVTGGHLALGAQDDLQQDVDGHTDHHATIGLYSTNNASPAYLLGDAVRVLVPVTTPMAVGDVAFTLPKPIQIADGQKVWIGVVAEDRMEVHFQDARPSLPGTEKGCLLGAVNGHS